MMIVLLTPDFKLFFFLLFYRYTWGVGTDKGKDDIVPFLVLSRDVKEKCAKAALNHNEKYFSTVIAKNSALNPKTIKATSDGGSIR